MKKSWKRVLSAVLTLVMIAGLLVVPAAAEDLTGAVNDKWTFGPTEFTNTECTAGAYKGLTLTNVKNQASENKDHAMFGNDGKIGVPVAGQCNVEVTFNWGADATVGVGSDTVAIQMSSGTVTSGTNPLVYHYAPTDAGTVDITGGSSTSFVTQIAIKDYTPAPAPAEVKDATLTVITEDNYESAYKAKYDPDNTDEPGGLPWLLVEYNRVAESGEVTFSVTKDETAVAFGNPAGNTLAYTANTANANAFMAFHMAAQEGALAGQTWLNQTADVAEGEYEVTVAMGDTTIKTNKVTYSTAPAQIPQEWWFRNGKEGNLAGPDVPTVQGAAQTWKGLEIDASASGAKFAPNGSQTDWVQFNTGCVIKVPVFETGTQTPVAEGTKVNVTVQTFGGANKLKVGETANTANAGVDEVILATADANGYITITATASDYLGHIKVVPVAEKKVTAITVSGPDTVEEGKSITLTAAVTPTDATDKTVEWSSAADATATVDPATGKVTGVAEGQVKITATAKDGSGVKGEKTVTVTAATPVDTSKIDVYDFAPEALDEAKYNNMLSVADVKTWVNAEGKVPAAGFEGENLSLYPNNSSDGKVRLYTNVTEIGSATGDANLSGEDGTAYHGALYYNGGNTKAMLVLNKLTAGDKVTYVVSNNGGTPTKYVFSKNTTGTALGDEVARVETKGEKVGTYTFYAPADGKYSLSAETNKLYVLRIYVEHPSTTAVSGTVTAPAGIPAGYKLALTNDVTGSVYEAEVANGSYTANVDNYQSGATYTLSLVGADDYVVKTGAAVTLAAADKTKTNDVVIEAVDLVNVSGTVTGLKTADLANLVLTITKPEGKVFQPVLAYTGANFTGKFEKGVTYTLTAANVNDYTLSTTSVKFDADATGADIVFAAKPVYAVTVTAEPTSVDLSAATITFVNVKDVDEVHKGGYTYEFTGVSDIKLRDGQYKVTVDGADATQDLTPDLRVTGEATDLKVPFVVTTPTKWNLVTADAAAMAKAAKGLTLTNVTYHGNKYGSQTKGGTYGIPVPGPCTVKVSVGFNWDVYIPEAADHNTAETAYKDNTDSGDITVEFTYTGAAGTVTLTTGSTFTSYVKAIEVVENKPYKATLTVGEGKDYATVSEAVAAAAAMDRPNNERVTIMIDPGDYEEQLWVETPNITLKNAAATPSIELKNKGVDIDANAVRITWYYGHGYTYYSMTDNHRYSAKVLEVNKANGYASFTNLGSGNQNAGSYWNATAVIKADGFEADGIIFENSFNQYVSKKAAEDVLEPQSGAKEDASAPRATLPERSTKVQDKKYVERAAALAIANGDFKATFNNCAFIGRQDTLDGGTGVKAAFYGCDVYGGTDYIMGPMTAVFAKCNLLFNTSEDKNDVGYITAPQNDSTKANGLLLYNCTVTSTTPGVNTASAKRSKPGLFGRAWEKNGEAIFYKTIIEATDPIYFDAKVGVNSTSLIQPGAWPDGTKVSYLPGGASKNCAEFGTTEWYVGVDNSAARDAKHGGVLTEEKSPVNGTPLTPDAWLGDAFADFWADKNLTIVEHTPGTAPDIEDPDQPGDLPSGGSTVTGGGSGVTVISGGNKSETVVNEDGSKTTTTVDKDGNKTIVTEGVDGAKTEIVSKADGEKTIKVTDAAGEELVKVEIPATVPAPEAPFIDVPEDHWAKEAIDTIAGLGLVKGVDDVNHVYDMTSNITRGALASVLHRFSNGKAGLDSSFTDVLAGAWYTDGVAWAAKVGVVTGYENGTFGPDNAITRQELAVMLYRYAKLIGMDVSTKADVSRFNDSAAVASWAKEAMTWCTEAGIVKGVGGNTLNPEGVASRAECAVMLSRFIDLV